MVVIIARDQALQWAKKAKKSVIEASRVVVVGRERVAAFPLPSPPLHLLCSSILLCYFIPVFCLFSHCGACSQARVISFLWVVTHISALFIVNCKETKKFITVLLVAD